VFEIPAMASILQEDLIRSLHDVILHVFHLIENR
jgi:hypothetical protein